MNSSTTKHITTPHTTQQKHGHPSSHPHTFEHRETVTQTLEHTTHASAHTQRHRRTQTRWVSRGHGEGVWRGLLFMTMKHTHATFEHHTPHFTHHPTPPHRTSRTQIHTTIPQTDTYHHIKIDTDRETSTYTKETTLMIHRHRHSLNARMSRRCQAEFRRLKGNSCLTGPRATK